LTKPPKHRIRMAVPRIATHSGATARTFVAPHGTKRTVVGRNLTERRVRFRALYPLCCICAHEGRVRAFDWVDHRHALEDGGPDVDENCWGLCDECHIRKTNAENERRAVGGDRSVPLPWLPPRPVELEPRPAIA
jgi:5-methylcytosine-specific restriction endonuclease McrA